MKSATPSKSAVVHGRIMFFSCSCVAHCRGIAHDGCEGMTADRPSRTPPQVLGTRQPSACGGSLLLCLVQTRGTKSSLGWPSPQEGTSPQWLMHCDSLPAKWLCWWWLIRWHDLAALGGDGTEASMFPIWRCAFASLQDGSSPAISIPVAPASRILLLLRKSRDKVHTRWVLCFPVILSFCPFAIHSGADAFSGRFFFPGFRGGLGLHVWQINIMSRGRSLTPIISLSF